ncbi:rhomboid family intramembrane serine protease [Shewanella pneumatophori]|uniref:Rhomboid family intramembrane serine protease n=1 Tax=Shewanella pneumatophori TaxID=314092 RepID=A0A9X1ZKK8_9GAMM|nr:rhomboid family intramembrane serine protease [Shewanella pneumatophori]MCL1137616.1 rhomboid family intramembrane serine protease [Shewanella pneumatophori]
MSMKCPGCASEEVRVSFFHGEEVDSCTSCGGIWFDSGELNAALSAADNGNDSVVIENSLGAHKGASDKSCSHCDVKLEHYNLMDGFQVEVDVCHSCTGVWIDEHEREKVVQSPQIQAALEHLNQKVNVKTWVFQFLMQMPMEYNLKPKTTPWVTYSLIVINTLIFLATVLQPSATEWIYETFALKPVDLMQGQNITGLVSHMFMHGGWMHLIGNMYFLYVVGDNLEDALGHNRFLALYLICGFAAAAGHIISEPSSSIYMVGASGAIAGLFGMYLLWFRHASLTFMFIVYQKKLSPMAFFAIWLAMNLFGAYVGGDGVAYWAHIAGFVAGLIIGFGLKEKVMQANPILAMLNSQELKVAR